MPNPHVVQPDTAAAEARQARLKQKAAQADLEKLRANLGGVKNMQRVPDALFVIDLKTEAIAVREAQRLRVSTRCDYITLKY